MMDSIAAAMILSSYRESDYADYFLKETLLIRYKGCCESSDIENRPLRYAQIDQVCI